MLGLVGRRGAEQLGLSKIRAPQSEERGLSKCCDPSTAKKSHQHCLVTMLAPVSLRMQASGECHPAGIGDQTCLWVRGTAPVIN